MIVCTIVFSFNGDYSSSVTLTMVQDLSATRKSKRIAALSATTTPLSITSPVFTSARESMAPETPVTSDDGTNVAGAVQIRKGKARADAKRSVNIMTRNGSRKRPIAYDDADEDASRPLKRRVVSSRVYVSLPIGTKGRVRSIIHNLWILAERLFQPDIISPRHNKKGKQKAFISSEVEDTEESPVVEDSDSEFQPEEDEEDEKAMLATAVRLSLQTAGQINEAGPSSVRVSGLSEVVRRRVVEAERRLTARRSDTFGYSTAEELEDDPSEEESQTKPAVISQATKKATSASAFDMSDISYGDFMAVQKRKRTAFLSARRANKKEERALMQKLRRKLTHVS